MFGMKRDLFCVIAIAALSLAGCGGGSGSSTTPTMSQAQAQAVGAAFSDATSAALQSSTGVTAYEPRRIGIASAVKEMRPDVASGCTSTASGESCTFPVSSSDSQPCTGGGTIAVSGTVTGAFNNSGSGSLIPQLTLTPQNCSVDGVVVEGAPSVAGTGTITLVDSAPVFPIVLSEVGDISFGAGACPVNLTYTVSSLTSCTMTGTACGEAISGTC